MQDTPFGLWKRIQTVLRLPEIFAGVSADPNSYDSRVFYSMADPDPSDYLGDRMEAMYDEGEGLSVDQQDVALSYFIYDSNRCISRAQELLNQANQSPEFHDYESILANSERMISRARSDVQRINKLCGRRYNLRILDSLEADIKLMREYPGNLNQARQLTSELVEAVDTQDYERAAQLRDQLQELKPQYALS